MNFPRRKAYLPVILLLMIVSALGACKSSAGLIGPADETAAAGEIIESANEDLKKIKTLYRKNENKREEIKKAMETDDADTVRKLSDDVVYVIAEGAALGKNALDKIDEARSLNINKDYSEYLRLKWDALNSQIEAFEEYRQAARKLRDAYDPKNTQNRDTVAADFKDRSEKYQKLMEKARDYSSQANDLRKEVLQRKEE